MIVFAITSYATCSTKAVFYQTLQMYNVFYGEFT